jgi:proline dehydrogenase
MKLLDRFVSLTLPAVPKPIVGYFSRRYIAGDRMDDAFRVVRELASEGALSTLDILGEFISSIEESDANRQSYDDLVRAISERAIEGATVSVKLTSMGLLLDQQQCLQHMRSLMHTVEESGNFLRIDMEDSPCTTATLDVYRALRREFPQRIGIVLQSRLRRTMQDVDDLVSEPTNVRLCKGIYLEPRDIAFTDAELIRRNFTAVLERLFEAGAYVGIATHDERLVWDAQKLIRRFGLSREQYEFQMLLGVDEPLRRILIREGHRLRVYVPFGEHWYAYSVRRLRENPQIAGYAFKRIFSRA